MVMTGKTTKTVTDATVEKGLENTLQHYSYAPLVQIALKLANRIKAARDQRAGVTPPGAFDGSGRNHMIAAEQEQQARPVSTASTD